MKNRHSQLFYKANNINSSHLIAYDDFMWIKNDYSSEFCRWISSEVELKDDFESFVVLINLEIRYADYATHDDPHKHLCLKNI